MEKDRLKHKTFLSETVIILFVIATSALLVTQMVINLIDMLK